MQHSARLVDLRSGDEPRFGGKSAGLGELLAGGIPVPPGFALSTTAFRAFVHESGLNGAIVEAMARVSPGDLDTIGAAETLRRIQSFADRYGERWRPAPLLVHMARKGDRFYA